MTKKIYLFFFFTSSIIYSEYMARIDMNENIVIWKFLTQNVANKISVNYSSYTWKRIYTVHVCMCTIALEYMYIQCHACIWITSWNWSLASIPYNESLSFNDSDWRYFRFTEILTVPFRSLLTGLISNLDITGEAPSADVFEKLNTV